MRSLQRFSILTLVLVACVGLLALPQPVAASVIADASYAPTGGGTPIANSSGGGSALAQTVLSNVTGLPLCRVVVPLGSVAGAAVTLFVRDSDGSLPIGGNLAGGVTVTLGVGTAPGTATTFDFPVPIVLPDTTFALILVSGGAFTWNSGTGEYGDGVGSASDGDETGTFTAIGIGLTDFGFSTFVTPEPGTMTLMGIVCAGLGGYGGLSWRRKKKKQADLATAVATPAV